VCSLCFGGLPTQRLTFKWDSLLAFLISSQDFRMHWSHRLLHWARHWLCGFAFSLLSSCLMNSAIRHPFERTSKARTVTTVRKGRGSGTLQNSLWHCLCSHPWLLLLDNSQSNSTLLPPHLFLRQVLLKTSFPYFQLQNFPTFKSQKTDWLSRTCYFKWIIDALGELCSTYPNSYDSGEAPSRTFPQRKS
jgi:hypothetical protein